MLIAYLITIAISVILLIIYFTAIAIDLKNLVKQGYKMEQNNTTKGQKIIMWTKMIFLTLIPVVNLIFSLIVFFSYDELINESKKHYKLTDEAVKEE